MTRRSATMSLMAAPPASTKTSLQQRLSDHARTHWPQLAGVTVRFRGAFAYVDGQLPNGETLALMRLRYSGSAARWGFAMYLYSKEGYEDAVLPSGAFAGLPEDARTRLRRRPLPQRPHALTNPRRTYKPDHLVQLWSCRGGDQSRNYSNLTRDQIT